jgi:predicted nucleotidyltransferase
MKKYFDTFLKVIDALGKAGVEYVLIGGYAVVIYGHPRFTEDMDLFIRLEKNNIDRLRHALDSVFHDVSLEELTVEDIDQYPVIRYGAPNGFLIDIIARIGEMYGYDDMAYEIVEIEGHQVRIATPETLLRMKQDTVRPQDHKDAQFLRSLIEQRKKS